MYFVLTVANVNSFFLFEKEIVTVYNIYSQNQLKRRCNLLVMTHLIVQQLAHVSFSQLVHLYVSLCNRIVSFKPDFPHKTSKILGKLTSTANTPTDLRRRTDASRLPCYSRLRGKRCLLEKSTVFCAVRFRPKYFNPDKNRRRVRIVRSTDAGVRVTLNSLQGYFSEELRALSRPSVSVAKLRFAWCVIIFLTCFFCLRSCYYFSMCLTVLNSPFQNSNNSCSHLSLLFTSALGFALKVIFKISVCFNKIQLSVILVRLIHILFLVSIGSGVSVYSYIFAGCRLRQYVALQTSSSILHK